LRLPLQDEEWNQEEFERLLSEWMVVCDQPFDEVDEPAFRRLLEYTHFRSSLHIPHRHGMKRRIMKMGEDTVEGIKKMIQASPEITHRKSSNLIYRSWTAKLVCPLMRGHLVINIPSLRS
jgi:hypothetical protein